MTEYMAIRNWPINFAVVLFALSFLSFSEKQAAGDEIVIDAKISSNEQAVGDFTCSPCLAEGRCACLPVDVEMSAGELWCFFNSQGIESVNELKLFVDVDQLSESARFDLAGLNVQIQHPQSPSQLLTNLSMKDSSLVVPGSGTSAMRPEAEIKFDLGYDFMKEFSSTSTEKVVFNFKGRETPVSGSSPMLMLASSDASVFTQGPTGLVFGFILFWGLIFLAMNRFIRPVTEQTPAVVFKSKSPSVS